MQLAKGPLKCAVFVRLVLICWFSFLTGPSPQERGGRVLLVPEALVLEEHFRVSCSQAGGGF